MQGSRPQNRITVTREQIAGMLDAQIRALSAHQLNQLSEREIGYFGSYQILVLASRGKLADPLVRPVQVALFKARLKEALDAIFSPADSAKQYEYICGLLERGLSRYGK